MRIRFLKSPTGAYKLGYDAGDVVDLPEAQCMEMIDTGFAEAVDQPTKSIEQIKSELVVKGIPFHPNAGRKKLEELNA
jgi:hypothetical protein